MRRTTRDSVRSIEAVNEKQKRSSPTDLSYLCIAAITFHRSRSYTQYVRRRIAPGDRNPEMGAHRTVGPMVRRPPGGISVRRACAAGRMSSYPYPSIAKGYASGATIKLNGSPGGLRTRWGLPYRAVLRTRTGPAPTSLCSPPKSAGLRPWRFCHTSGQPS